MVRNSFAVLVVLDCTSRPTREHPEHFAARSAALDGPDVIEVIPDADDDDAFPTLRRVEILSVQEASLNLIPACFQALQTICKDEFHYALNHPRHIFIDECPRLKTTQETDELSEQLIARVRELPFAEVKPLHAGFRQERQVRQV